ncbi:MAG TPA: MlaD family protein [Armatimonadota bacterium]|jgi:phospholipid/cholesterol/gamma-HCH transport system substrate-binding protein
MAQSNAAAKVGAVVLLAAGLFGGVVYFFVGRGAGGYPLAVTFKDAQGIKQQADVRLAGVKIGVVQDIDVDPTGARARLHMRIFKDRRIPAQSTYTLTSGGLLGEMFVQITAPPPAALTGRFLPTKGPETTIRGTDLPTFDDLKVQMAELSKGSQSVLNNLNTATRNVASLTGDPVLQRALRNTALNAERMSTNANGITGEIATTVRRLNATIDQELPLLQAALRNVEKATGQASPMASNANKLISDSRKLVRDLGDTNAFLRQTMQDTVEGTDFKGSMKTTLANLAAASEQMKLVAENARRISDDLANKGESTSKVGEVVTTVRDAATKATTLLDRLNAVANRAGKGHVKLPTVGSQMEARHRLTGDNPFSADVTLGISGGSGGAVLLGLQDIGDGNKLKLLNSVSATPRLSYHYGFEYSKLGGGVEYLLRGSALIPTIAYAPGTQSIGADVSNPNNLRLDLRARRQVTDKLGVLIGFDDVLHRGQPTVGLTYRP